MDKQHFSKFNQYMSVLGEIVGSIPSPDKIKIYWKVLSKYKAADVFMAFDRILEKPKLYKFPVPGDIIDLFSEDSEGKALNAWQKVRIGVRRAGYMRSVKFDDPVIHNVLQSMGGWKTFCSMDEDDERFYRPQFLKAYAAFSRLHSQGKLQSIPYLPGEAEITNISRGNEKFNEPPMAIGDKTVKNALEYTPQTALPETTDIIPPEEAKAKIKALISNITKQETKQEA